MYAYVYMMKNRGGPMISFFCLILAAAATLCVVADTLSVYEGALVFGDVVTSRGGLANVDASGFLTAFNRESIDSFSMDVGFNRGQTTSPWLTLNPNLFVIAVEANANLVAHFEFSNAVLNERIKNRAFVIRAAAGSKPGLARFNPGNGWNNVSDTGSLFNWKDAEREKVRIKYASKELLVRVIRLESILSHVPPPSLEYNGPRKKPFLWDTLKIDVQGADVDALLSCGEYIKNFACVVAEFDVSNYNVPSEIPTDPSSFLREHGFVYSLAHGNHFWMNKKFIELYRQNPENFSCHRVYDSVVEPSLILKGYDAGGIPWKKRGG